MITETTPDSENADQNESEYSTRPVSPESLHGKMPIQAYTTRLGKVVVSTSVPGVARFQYQITPEQARGLAVVLTQLADEAEGHGRSAVG